MGKFDIVFLIAGHVVIWSLSVAMIFSVIGQMGRKWRKFKYVTIGVKKMNLQELRWLHSECEKQIVERLEQQRQAKREHYTT